MRIQISKNWLILVNRNSIFKILSSQDSIRIDKSKKAEQVFRHFQVSE